MPETAANIWALGPSSDPYKPDKSKIIAWGTWVEAFISAGLSSGSSAIYDTQANLFANLVWIANTLAWVVDDPDVAKNGVYRKIGSSGTGSWTRVADLPYSFIAASDTGAGTPDAIQATSSLPVSSSALVVLNVYEANTGSPVTVSFNGGPALTIKTNTGIDITPNGLVAGIVLLGYVSASTFRLINDEAIASLIFAARDEAVSARDDAESAQDAAEAARDIAAGYASDAVSQGNVPIYATVVGMPALEVPVGMSAIRVNGGSVAGDSEGGLFTDVSNGRAVAFTSGGATSRYWYPADDSIGAAVWSNGTYRTMRERGRDTYCILDAPGGADPTGANLSTASLKAMEAEASGTRGLKLDFLAGNYRINEGLVFDTPVEIVGRGRGYWHPKPPSSGDGLSSAAATQIILTSTGPKVHSVHGVSSNRASGGVVANPSASNGNDAEYSLSSFMNPVSDGAAARSPLMFSAGALFRPGAAGSIVSDLRFITDGGGAEGLDKYTIAGSPDDDWADDWDYGIVNEMASKMLFCNVESVGHFRRAGYLLLAIPADPGENPIPAVFGVAHHNLQVSGWRALEVRGPDMCRVTAVGADYIEVPWWDDHPFDPSVYGWLGIGGGGFSISVSRTFTTISKVGSALRLGGMASVVGVSVGNYVTSRRMGAGTSQCHWDQDCKFTGMNHQSGEVCHSAALGSKAMPHPGEAISISGWRATELSIKGAIQTIEEVAIHTHAIAASTIRVNKEGSGPKPARIITSPHESSSTARVTNPAGKTQNCIIDSIRGLRDETGIDTRPRLPSAESSSAYPSDSGFFDGFNTQTPSLMVDAHGPNGAGSNPLNAGLRAQPGMQVGLLNRDGGSILTYDDASDFVRLTKNIQPNAANSLSIGSVTNRLLAVYTTAIKYSNENRFIQWGSGSPEGVVTGVKGAIWIRTDGSAGACLYVMESTAGGNTGWVLK